MVTRTTDLRSRSGHEVVLADEELLASQGPTCAVSILSRPCLTLGVRQSDSNPVALRARELRIDVVRRSTGGTGVYTDAGDLAWSLALPVSHPLVGRDFVRAYPRLGRGVVTALGELGMSTAWTPPPGIHEGLCVLGARGQVLVGGGRILGGAAQRRTASRLLHHGFLARRIDATRQAELFGVSGTVVREHLAGWEELGLAATSEEVGRRIAEALVREARSG